MDTLVEKLSNCCDYILRLSGFPDLSGKVLLITFKGTVMQMEKALINDRLHVSKGF